jgi:hypothetical protein
MKLNMPGPLKLRSKLPLTTKPVTTHLVFRPGTATAKIPRLSVVRRNSTDGRFSQGGRG